MVIICVTIFREQLLMLRLSMIWKASIYRMIRPATWLHFVHERAVLLSGLVTTAQLMRLACYCLKHGLHNGWLCITYRPASFIQGDVVHWLFMHHCTCMYLCVSQYTLPILKDQMLQLNLPNCLSRIVLRVLRVSMYTMNICRHWNSIGFSCAVVSSNIGNV